MTTQLPVAGAMAPEDHERLKQAVALLEGKPLIMKITNMVGQPLEWLTSQLSESKRNKITDLTHVALQKAMSVSLTTLDVDDKGSEAGALSHKLGATITGGIGGFFGMAGLAVELPITTGIILRSIAAIARELGEDLRDEAVQRECLNVFALEGGRMSDKGSDDDAEAGFFVTRAMLNKILSQSTSKWLEIIATRFGVTVGEKVAAQAAPVLGAVAGATLNNLFIDYYQDMARGYFTIRKLERDYSPALVQMMYGAERQQFLKQQASAG